MRTSRILRLAVACLPCTGGNDAMPQQPFDLDPSFRAEADVQYASSSLPLDDGRVLISGKFVFPGDNPASPRYGVRLLPDGSVDPTFLQYPGMGGKIMPWNEQFYCGAGQSVRRLNMDGAYDPSFISMNLGPYFGSLQGGDYHVFPDGRVLMSGAHTLDDPTRGFVGLYNLIWFSNEGYLDTTRTHRYCDEVIFAIEEQPDGKFLCSGTMNSFEGQPVKRVFRIHADGALDNSFDADIQQWGEARDYLTMSDGRIWVGGSLRLNGSENIKSLVRFMPGGAIDPTFHVPQFAIEFDPFATIPVLFEIREITPDRYIVTGRFDRVDGQVRGGIAMLDGDGNLVDDAFTGEGCGLYDYNGSLYKSISGITPAPDGSYYIYGAYHGYDDGTTNDTEQRMVSRLYGLDVGVGEQNTEQGFRVFPNPCATSLSITCPSTATSGNFSLLDMTGRTVRSWQTAHVAAHQTTVSVDGLAPGHYVLRAEFGAERRCIAVQIQR